MDRRNFIGLMATGAGSLAGASSLSAAPRAAAPQIGRQILMGRQILGEASDDPYTLEEIRRLLPEDVPRGIAALITRRLNQKPAALNTDWDGAFQVEGLLRWSARGLEPGLSFARAWFDHHLERDRRLTDEQFYETYRGARARVMRSGPLPFSLYAGNFAVAFPTYLLYEHTGNETAEAVPLEVAEAILHYAARDRYGLVAHDDQRVCQLSIPDVGYFAVRSLSIASTLASGPLAEVYRKQALFQARTYFEVFFDEQEGLTRTGNFDGEQGQTYWTRASGWLLWTLTSLLRHLPEEHPAFAGFTGRLQQMADGLAGRQGPGGGLRVWVDDQSSPEEVTGTAMCVQGVQEGMRKGWLPAEAYAGFVRRGGAFIRSSVTEEGAVENAYTGWALPAERKELVMDHKDKGFVPGMVMAAAEEMTR